MNELGTREHYAEYVRNCENAGINPESWEMFRLSFANAPEHDPRTPANERSTTIDGAGLTYSSQTTIETMRQDLALAANEVARLQRELDAAREAKQEEARITVLSALDLVARWRMKWQQLIEDKVCEITDNDGWIVRDVKDLSREVEAWKPDGGAVAWLAAEYMSQLTVRWLDMPAGSGHEEKWGWSYERLEADYRKVCNNLKTLVDEMDLGGYGEKLDVLVIRAFHQQQAENEHLQRELDAANSKLATARAALAKLDDGEGE